MSAFSAIFVLKENWTQSHSAKFLNWGDQVNSVPDLAASPPWARKCESKHWYACGADGRAAGGRAGGVRSRDYQIFWDG